jgi:hypothetical protein
MGQKAQILLVKTTRLASTLLIALCFVLAYPGDAKAGTASADDFSSFWIWGGVKAQPLLGKAEQLYILQGAVVEMRSHDESRVCVVSQGMPVARIKKGQVWLVYRVETLHWTPAIVHQLICRLKEWQRWGNPVVGLQIDFDSGSLYLNEYAAFLRQLRSELPAEYRLSISGLLDWSSTGDVTAINGLTDVIDEIVIQTYQGRMTIANYQTYMPALKRLCVPFRIGVVQEGEWQAPDDLERNPMFRGYVMFLLNKR